MLNISKLETYVGAAVLAGAAGVAAQDKLSYLMGLTAGAGFALAALYERANISRYSESQSGRIKKEKSWDYGMISQD